MRYKHKCHGRRVTGFQCWYAGTVRKQGHWWCRQHAPPGASEPAFLTDREFEELVLLRNPTQDTQQLIEELRMIRELPEVRRRIR